MRMVLGKSWINRNGFRIIIWHPDKLMRSSDFLDYNSDGPDTYPDSAGTSENGPGRSWKCSRRFRNVPKRSRKVPEGPGSFWKVPGSTTHYPTPLALGTSHLGCPKSSKGWGAKYGRNPTPSRI